MNSLERKVKTALKKEGIECYRHSIKNFPDFLCLYKNNIFFIECKKRQKSFSIDTYKKTKQFKKLAQVNGFLVLEIDKHILFYDFVGVGKGFFPLLTKVNTMKEIPIFLKDRYEV